MAFVERRRGAVATLGIVLIGGACGESRHDERNAESRYIVTASPLDVGVGSGGLCFAVDPRGPNGLWWWGPGEDCSTRSTGPGVFQAEGAMVSTGARPGSTDIRFRLQVIRGPSSPDPPFVDVRLALASGQLQALATGSRVATVARQDLDIPQARP